MFDGHLLFFMFISGESRAAKDKYQDKSDPSTNAAEYDGMKVTF